MKNSLAYSRGKQMYQSLGTLNPNLNVEDEYVENLLKQIQFLSLETKLIKEKHSQTKGFGIMALIDKENLPVVDHLLASGEKYKEMRNQLSQMSNQLMFQNIELEAEERGLMRKREYHDDRQKRAAKRNSEEKAKMEEMLKDLERQYSQAKSKYETLSKGNQRLVKAIKEREVELEKLSSDNMVGAILGMALTLKSDSEYQLEQEDLALKESNIAVIRGDIKKYEQQLQKNLKYIELVEESKHLNKNLQDQQKTLSSLQFKLLETESTARLAQSEKEKEIKQRRAAEQDLYTTKQLLEEVVKGNELKIEKRRAERVKNSAQIKKMEVMISRLETDLEENRKKTQKADDTCHKYSTEQKASLIERDRLSHRAQQLKQTLAKITTSNTHMETDITALHKQNETTERQLADLRKQNTKLSGMLCEIEESYTQESERNDFFESNVTLKEELKNIRVEELCGVMQNNLDVNKTVGALISKWKDIQNFSRV